MTLLRFSSRVRASLLAAASLLASAMPMNGKGKPLQFHPDGTFKIVQFTDVHWRPSNPHSTVARECMNNVLDAERPDLVVFTGDVVYGAPAKEALLNAMQPCVERGIPFALTFGNHDDEQDLTREQLFGLLTTLPGNLTDSVANLTGVTNYTIELHGSKNPSKVAALLYVLDTNSYCNLPTAKGYGGVAPDQVAWYGRTSRAYTAANGGQPLPAVAFFHIPLNEHNTAARDEDGMLIGIRREEACSPSLNSGLFSEMLHCGDVMATFVGHDHVNDYAVNHKGILFAYGRYTGGPTVYCDIPGGPGARVIEMHEGERGFNTWIRTSSGTVYPTTSFPHDYSHWKSEKE